MPTFPRPNGRPRWPCPAPWPLAGRRPGQGRVLAAARRVRDEAARGDPPLVLDYLALAEPDTFTPLKPGFAGEALLLVAARVGTNRLIDNTPLTLGGPNP